ncbi:MAG: 4-(cytidine 5'-diphospho)-2-C-methyl-D-erythritol kinase, partial [Varibaculum timonense]
QSLGRAYLVNKDALKLVPADLENLAALSESAGEAGKELDKQQGSVQNSGKAFLPEILVSNLPYNVAVPVLLHLFAVFPSLKRALVMVQKEVAVRLSAPAGSKVYGVPSVKIAWYGKARMKSDISRRVFYPQPNVDSALVEIVRAPSRSLCLREEKQKGYLSSEKEISGYLGKTLTAPEQEHRQREVVFELIDCAFASRRKMLRSSLKTWAAPLAVTPLLQAAGIAPTSRAETLTIRDFVALAKLRSVLESRVEKSPIIPKKTANNITTLEREDNSAPASLPAAPSKPSLSAAETASARQAQAVSNGKINLFLAATRENDGYHPLSTLFQAVNLREKVTISLQEQGLDIDIKFDAPEGAVGYSPDRDQQALTGLEIQNNLATRAFLLVAQQCGYQGGAKITIEKQVPVAGGMAGGSADAAAALLAANQVLAAGLSRNQLAEIGAKLGADVPFGIYGGTCFADRYGDRITPLPPANSLSLVAAVSPNTLATPEVFRQYDKSGFLRQKLPNLAELNPLLQALYQADLSVLAKLIQNDLQNPAIKLLPQLAVTLETAKQQGAVAF